MKILIKMLFFIPLIIFIGCEDNSITKKSYITLSSNLPDNKYSLSASTQAVIISARIVKNRSVVYDPPENEVYWSKTGDDIGTLKPVSLEPCQIELKLNGNTGIAVVSVAYEDMDKSIKIKVVE